MMIHGKRGGPQDFIVIFAFLTVFLVTILVASVVGSAIMEDPDFENTMNDTAAGRAGFTTWDKIKDRGLDSMFAGMYFLLHIGAIALAYLLPTYGPVFLGINIILILAIGILGSMFQDVFKGIMEAFALSNFPMTTWIANHLFMTEIIFAIMMAFAIYQSSKRMGEGAGGGI